MATLKFSAQTPASAIGAADSFVGVQAAANVKYTGAQIKTWAQSGVLLAANNLSDVTAATARTNLGVTATGADTAYAFRANDLSDVANAATARTNLGVTATGADTAYAFRANNLSDVASAATALGNLGGSTAPPGVISGNWYLPYSLGTLAVGGALAINTIALLPVLIQRATTIKALAAVITTIGTTNIQLALYANNGATGRPTGNPVASTGNIVNTATGPVSAAITQVTAALTPGLYWMAINCGDSAAIMMTETLLSPQLFNTLIGSATLANVIASGATATYLASAQTFGTWPDLTAASFTETKPGGTSTNKTAVLALQVN